MARCRAAMRRISLTSAYRSRRNASTLVSVGWENTASTRNAPDTPSLRRAAPAGPPPAPAGTTS